MAQTKHKSYVDKHHRGLEFEVSNHIFLKVSPVWGVIRFGQKRGKLLLWFIRPFEILERVGKVLYRLTLPPKMPGVCSVFTSICWGIAHITRRTWSILKTLKAMTTWPTMKDQYEFWIVKWSNSETKRFCWWRFSESITIKMKHHRSLSKRCMRRFRIYFDIVCLRFRGRNPLLSGGECNTLYFPYCTNTYM